MTSAISGIGLPGDKAETRTTLYGKITITKRSFFAGKLLFCARGKGESLLPRRGSPGGAVSRLRMAAEYGNILMKGLREREAYRLPKKIKDTGGAHGRNLRDKREKYLVAALLLVGMLTRLVFLDRFPGGIDQDEAYSAYEAYCLMTDGMDSWGYRYPVYLTVWGSGQSALQSYLMAPLIALFGLKLWVIRMPQAILACVSLPVMYALLRRISGRRTALIGLAFLAICPWHITMARWGLDCNFAPGFLLMGLYFFVKGLDEPRYFAVCGLIYGLSLYTYAVIWLVLPFMLLLDALYLLYVGKLKPSRWLILGTAILGILAVPLLLFLAVNWGLIPEITGPFFSVPKMPQMRDGEVSLASLYENVYRMVKTFLLQRDDRMWNASDEFGLYYHFSLPFMVIGGLLLLKRTAVSLRKKRYDASALIVIWLLLGVIQGCLIDGSVNRLNFLHFPLILCAVTGIDGVCQALRGRLSGLRAGIAAAYAVSFALFVGFYFTGYQEKIDAWYDKGLDAALAYAQECTEGVIRISDQIEHPKILFYGQIEPEVFRNTVVWDGEPRAFMRIESVDRYRFGIGDAERGVCVLPAEELGDELPEGRNVRIFDRIAVVF